MRNLPVTASISAANDSGQHPRVYAVDVSAWPRCDAECSPGRAFYYYPSRHSAGQPIVASWAHQLVAELGFEGDSWVAPVDAKRVRPEEDAKLEGGRMYVPQPQLYLPPKVKSLRRWHFRHSSAGQISIVGLFECLCAGFSGSDRWRREISGPLPAVETLSWCVSCT
jgi:hypothetical protein